MDETTLASQDESFALSATRASAGVPAGLDHTMASGAVAGADAGLVPGATTGRYILLEHLGAGAMGVVWSAWDPELDRRVAIKVLLRDTGRAQAEDRMRLQREAQSLARLAHPNVISVFDVGVFAERLFLAMEFVDGWTLRTWLREQHPARDAVHVAIAAAGRGLVAAHAAGLVHRDLKPDNVMIGRDGRVRVMDFGLARGLDQITGGTAGADPVLEQVRGLADTATELTQAGSLVGTPVYMAAELFQGMPADVRSDQFAFCVSAWEVLCGQRPFVGEDLKALKLAITSGRVTAPPADTLTRHQRATLERGLHPDPTRRWPSMEALLTALADDPTRGRRRRLGLALGFTLSAGALLGGYALTSGADRRCSDPAQQLAGTWDAVRSTELAAAIAGSGSPIAAATWPRVQMALDAWAGRWVAVAAPACLDQSTLAADLRPAQARCLAGQRAALDSLLKVLAGADADIVRNAQAAVAKLPDPQSCADPLVLASAVAPPAVALADTVERLDRAVDTARALRLAGKYAASEAAIRELLPELEATDYAPLTAEAQSELGDVLEQRSAFEESSATYTLALEHALRARDERQAAKLAVSLAAVLGARRHRVEESTLILRMAAAIARSLGDPTELAVQYEHTRAVIAVTNNAPAEARIWYEKELTRRRAENPDSPAVGDVLAGLGLVARNEGNLEEAARLALEVRAHYERTLVPDHPRIASAIDH